MRISIQLNGSQPRQYVVVAPMPTRKLSLYTPKYLAAQQSLVVPGCKSIKERNPLDFHKKDSRVCGLAWEDRKLPNKKCISLEMHFLFGNLGNSQAR